MESDNLLRYQVEIGVILLGSLLSAGYRTDTGWLDVVVFSGVVGKGKRKVAASKADSDSDEDRPNTRKGSELGLPPIPRFSDDGGRVSTSYKCLGLAHRHRTARVSSARSRAILICAANCDEWPHLRLSQCISEQLDLLFSWSVASGPTRKSPT